MMHFSLQKSLRLLSGILLVAMMLFVDSHESECKLRTCLIKFTNSSGEHIKLKVEVAATEQMRQKGLMYRMSLPENEGMIFIFEKDKSLSFWMKNTYIPLDIAFIDSRGVITDILQMRPLDTSVFYNSSKEVRYAVETNQWWFAKNRITAGSKADISGCISK